MALNVDPVIGNWYQRLDDGLEFEVIEFDEDEGIVEIQLLDGTSEEIDIDSWYALELEGIESPDDDAQSSDEDDDEPEDLGYDEEDWDEI